MQDTVDRKHLAQLAQVCGATVPQTALEPLACYLEMLCRWNAAMNLVGARSWREIWGRLVVDSFHLADFLQVLPLPAAPLCWDLGSGAGLPGIPLRMAFTRGQYYLVEAREKRAIFLSSTLRRLRLQNTHVFHGRAEHFFQSQPHKAHCIISRAFMPWQDVLTLTRSHLDEHGLVIIMALEPIPESLPRGWSAAGMHPYMAADDRRWLWAISPTSATGGV
ncbi:MAG: 16S rRNA (guanine(527)-N(7))-methyltransferase RsmG [Desulfovibrio sp.]|nr:16S rRNA (guanine(527)-N(7))-methyltransferase RsmG [Desulfovibrio sp.]